MDTQPVIELQGLEVRFCGRVILDNLTRSVSGQAIGLLGPNGAGKSTLINTLLGFYQPSRGTARIFGHDIRMDLRRVRSLIGYMPENEAFIAGMNAVEFVRYMGELSGLPPDAALERAHQALRATASWRSTRTACGSSSGSRRQSYTDRRCCFSTSRPMAWTPPRAGA